MTCRSYKVRKAFRTWALVILGLFLSGPVFAQSAPNFRSTEIHADHSVTFRYFAPAAGSVDLILENRATRIPMHKEPNGVWSVTTGPLRPQIYGYRFALDGKPKTVHDPQSSSRRYGNDLLLIPGHPPEPWEQAGAPHGAITTHEYVTKYVVGLPGNRSSFVVYTPPGYDLSRPLPAARLGRPPGQLEPLRAGQPDPR
jgi:enterochelin esterase family protein